MGVEEGGDVCTLMADSHGCMAETNTTLYSNYPPIKKSSWKQFKKIKTLTLREHELEMEPWHCIYYNFCISLFPFINCYGE